MKRIFAIFAFFFAANAFAAGESFDPSQHSCGELRGFVQQYGWVSFVRGDWVLDYAQRWASCDQHWERVETVVVNAADGACAVGYRCGHRILPGH